MQLFRCQLLFCCKIPTMTPKLGIITLATLKTLELSFIACCIEFICIHLHAESSLQLPRPALTRPLKRLLRLSNIIRLPRRVRRVDGGPGATGSWSAIQLRCRNCRLHFLGFLFLHFCNSVAFSVFLQLSCKVGGAIELTSREPGSG